MRPFFVSALLVLVFPLAALAAPRTWTDTKTNKSVKGDLVRVHNGEVIIAKLNKAVQKIPYWNLSEEDRDFVKAELEKTGDTKLIPEGPSASSGRGGLGAGGSGLGGSGLGGAGGQGVGGPSGLGGLGGVGP